LPATFASTVFPGKTPLCSFDSELSAMPEESARAQIQTYLSRLNELIVRGRQIRELVTENPTSAAAIAANCLWQQDCGATIHQLSGGSKAHWLARAFSEAFLVRAADGQALEGAAPEELVQRLLGVLEQGVASLSRMDEGQMQATSSPSPRRFDFVHTAQLRPILERAYEESRDAFDQGDYGAAMRGSCGILEAIVTDALEHKGLSTLADEAAPAGNISDWPFETRLAVAESAGLIRGGWARLTPAARAYRDNETSDATISERDARTAGQVLHVLMRDLNPGR
jgi:hypothetical protein